MVVTKNVLKHYNVPKAAINDYFFHVLSAKAKECLSLCQKHNLVLRYSWLALTYGVPHLICHQRGTYIALALLTISQYLLGLHYSKPNLMLYRLL